MELHNFEELRALLHNVKKTPVMAVAAAEDETAIDAILAAEQLGYARPILIGDVAEIKRILEKKDIDAKDYEMINASDKRNSGEIAVRLIKEEKADFIMKGLMETREVLGPVVDKEKGIGIGRIISHLAFNQINHYHKLLINTDAGMNIYPDLKQKTGIMRNAIDTLRAVGYECPKMAALCAVENVNPKMPETLDAAELKRMALAGEFGKCVVEGPISYDIALNREYAEHKHFDCPCSGDFDGVMVPNIACGNILGKSWTMGSGGSMAGIVVGTKAPIVLTSRASTMDEKINSIVFAAVMISGKGKELFV